MVGGGGVGQGAGQDAGQGEGQGAGQGAGQGLCIDPRGGRGGPGPVQAPSRSIPRSRLAGLGWAGELGITSPELLHTLRDYATLHHIKPLKLATSLNFVAFLGPLRRCDGTTESVM